MDEAGIRALLRAHVAWGVRPGGRVVTHDAVTAAGADPLAVDRFIIAKGGQRVDPAEDQPYWLVPQALLAAA